MCTQLCTEHSCKYRARRILGDCTSARPFCYTWCLGCHLFYSNMQWR